MSEEQTQSASLEDVAYDLYKKQLESRKDQNVEDLLYGHSALVASMMDSTTSSMERLFLISGMLAQCRDVCNQFSGANHEPLQKMKLTLESVVDTLSSLNSELGTVISQSRRAAILGPAPKTMSGRFANAQETKRLVEFATFITLKANTPDPCSPDHILNYLRSIAK